MAFGQIDPSRLNGDALRRWYLRSPADIEHERQEAAAQRYRDFFGGHHTHGEEGAPRQMRVDATQPGPSGIGMRHPQSGLFQNNPASQPTAGTDDNIQLAAASWAPSPDWICQACHGRSVSPPPPAQYTPPRSPGGNPPYAGGGGSSGKNPKQCAVQYENDASICRWVPGVDARRRCWESAARREAHCIQTKGQVGYPDLITR